MAVNGFALAGIGAGTIFLYTAIKGKSILATTQAIIQGKSPATINPVNTINTTMGTSAAAQLGSVTANPVSGSGGTSVPPSVGSVSVTQGSSQSQLEQYAFSQFAQYGWGTNQETPLINLWNKESNWRWNAANASGAYGIPQSLPANKMASAGADWQTNPETQIRWGLSYISSVYHNPQGAWDHEVANNWY